MPLPDSDVGPYIDEEMESQDHQNSIKDEEAHHHFPDGVHYSS